MILAIDTSVGISVALHDRTETICEFTTNEHGMQGELTAQYISDALAITEISATDISDVVVGVGPGPFTGLRVGLATAQTFAFALNIPVHGYCSLDALGSVTADECIVVSDARRKELYWARYVSGVRVEGPAVNKPDEISELFPQGKFIGPAADLYPEFINGSVLQIEAGNLAQLFTQGTGQIHEVVPMYLRKPDAVEPTTRKQVLR